MKIHEAAALFGLNITVYRATVLQFISTLILLTYKLLRCKSMSFNLRDCRYKTTLIKHNFLYILITRYTCYGLKLMALGVNYNKICTNML